MDAKDDPVDSLAKVDVAGADESSSYLCHRRPPFDR